MSVDCTSPPDRVVERLPVQVQVGGGRLHDGAVWGLVGHVQEQRQGAVVTFYPGHRRPETQVLYHYTYELNPPPLFKFYELDKSLT